MTVLLWCLPNRSASAAVLLLLLLSTWGPHADSSCLGQQTNMNMLFDVSTRFPWISALERCSFRKLVSKWDLLLSDASGVPPPIGSSPVLSGPGLFWLANP